MIDRVEVTTGAGTVIRFGNIVAWAAPTASPALISFLAQSARNLGPSPTGGHQIADHIAGVLGGRDPEPQVAFAVVGPSDSSWETLLHGPVQVWDGLRWLSPNPRPGWLQAAIDPHPAVTVGHGGTPTPALVPDAVWDLQAGVVPGAGFVLFPSVVSPVSPVDGPWSAGLTPVAAGEQADVEDPTTEESTAILFLPEATTVLPAVGEAAGSEPVPTEADAETMVQPEVEVEPSPAPGAQPEPTPTRAAGPEGSVKLLGAAAAGLAAPRPPLPVGRGPDRSIPGAPVVAGLLCDRGHLNRPGLPFCVRCSSPMPTDAAFTVTGTRPGLGCLVADDATIYRLDLGYVVGSDPGADPTVRGGLARPLFMTGDAVAASHAEIRLQDWDVVVADRGSAAGTCVFELNSPDWERLRPYQPRVLKPGTHIAFGQRIVTFVTPWVMSVPQET
ncbi:MAG TPA: FHA domain-containing protein [Acidimicrobiales bacterium]|nr:FHA domain-containing protein [Acidimicrobiales bacterium]